MFPAVVVLISRLAGVADHQIHLYTNSGTGEVLQHDGPRFEPVPPLEYTGSMQAPPSELQQERIAILKNRIRDIERDMDQLAMDSAKTEGWRKMALAFWSGNGVTPRTGCMAEDIEPQRAMCKAFCSAQPIIPEAVDGPQYLDICRPVSMMGMLNHPFSREWLYPPGNPMRQAGFGR
jgi:hypothetical protein